MAEELQYATGVGESNKRKYEDHQTSPAIGVRRPTGFSSPPRPSFNSVPPPMNEIELAKQKAQEIAARLLNTSDPAKRARVENGSGGGFDSNDQSFFQKPMGLGLSAPPQVASYGYPGGPGQSKKIEIPNGRVGVIIGKGGETIRYLQVQSGAKIQVTRDMDADRNSATRGVELMGSPDQIVKAEQLINDVLTEADAGSSGAVSRQLVMSSGAEQFVMKIANNKVGLVIGKGGETIKNMQARSGARIQVIPLHLPPGDTSRERTLQIDGTSEQIEIAKQLVYEVISENRPRNPAMSGYPQQGYQARPPANWGQPGPPVQQSGYGYVQPGAYPGPSPQYNPNQPPYPGYPPQPTSGGYATGWDQTTAAPNQPPAQEGGYDYYSQQPPPQQQAPGGSGPQTDSTAYGYNQPPAYNKGQGYPQDNYGGYYGAAAPQSGYGQPPANPVSGYDQQQQGYNATYSNVSNPTPDGHTPAYGTQGDANQVPASGQSYNAGGQPNPNPSYAPQGSTQPAYGTLPTSQGGFGTQPPANYGLPQVQKAPTGQPSYGQQPQQSPSSQGGHVQPGYVHSQPPPAQTGYSQTDSGAQRPPSTYPTSQAGYGPPAYGAPQPTQPSYGQQPPPYNSYAGGYYQPPAYPADGSKGGSAAGSYDAAPTSQIAQQPNGAPKASPSA